MITDLTNKAYLSAITVTNISESFTYKMAAKINWHRYGTKLRHYHPMCSLPTLTQQKCRRRHAGIAMSATICTGA